MKYTTKLFEYLGRKGKKSQKKAYISICIIYTHIDIYLYRYRTTMK